MSVHPVLVAGEWRQATSGSFFKAENPVTREALPGEYPESSWEDCEQMLNAAADAAVLLRSVTRPAIAAFLNRFADRLQERAEEIAAMAHLETGLAVEPRLLKVELPRTVDQLRQAATEAAEGSWVRATIDTKRNIRSMFAPVGPVCIFGPNNFPLAFNGVAGGDFAAAIAAGNPVIVKAHPLHPGTSRLLAEQAFLALAETGLPRATVQMVYQLSQSDGFRLVADRRLGATAFTGSREAGLALKASADAAGKPIYLEMSSLNPVVLLPGAVAERSSELALELVNSALTESGQLCTSPKLVLMVAEEATERFIGEVTALESSRVEAPMLSAGVVWALAASVKRLADSGAAVIRGAEVLEGSGYRYANTLLRVDGKTFLQNLTALKTEAFGNAMMFVVAADLEELLLVLSALGGNLTGCIYSSRSAADDAAYAKTAPRLEALVGRLLNDKMPTGVAVSSAMNHGGPYPSTGHPAFTSVGLPASLMRFAALKCYDNVRNDRLPEELRDRNPNPAMWRSIDREWSKASIGAN